MAAFWPITPGRSLKLVQNTKQSHQPTATSEVAGRSYAAVITRRGQRRVVRQNPQRSQRTKREKQQTQKFVLKRHVVERGHRTEKQLMNKGEIGSGIAGAEMARL